MRPLFTYILPLLILFASLAPVVPAAPAADTALPLAPAVAHAQNLAAIYDDPGGNPNGCGLTNLEACMASVVEIMLRLASTATALAGTLLDNAVEFTVLEMGTFIRDDAATGINAAWTVLRDLANVVFVFLLVFIGFATILRIEQYEFKKLIRNLVIAALFVNFSFFITGLVIDTANLAAISIHDELNIECPPGAAADCEELGIAGLIMEELELETIYSTESDVTGAENLLSQTGKLLLVMVFGIALLLIAAFVLAAAAVLLFIRFFALIFLLILSPLAFVAMAVPQLGGYAHRWWSTLFSQAFFAPAFLLLVFLSLHLIRGIGDEAGLRPEGANFAGALVGESGFGIVVNFVVAIGFLLGSLRIARNMGAYGAQTAINMGHGIRRGAQGALGRSTVGVASDRVKRLYDWTQGTRTGRNIRRAANVATLGLVSDKTIRDTLEKGAGAKFGSKEGYRDVRTAKEKEAEASVKRRLDKPEQAARYFRGLSQGDQKQIYEGLSARNRAALDEQLDKETQEQLRSGLSVEEREKTQKEAREAQDRDEQRKIRDRLEEIGKGAAPARDELEQLLVTGDPATGTKPLKPSQTRRLSHEARMHPGVIQNLSGRHLKDLMSEGDLQLDEVRQIRDVINGPFAYPNQRTQRDYINNPANRVFWQA